MTTTELPEIVPPTNGFRIRAADVRELVDRWYAAIVAHAEVDELLDCLASAGLILRFAGRTIRSHNEFRAWYADLTSAHFDQAREPVSVSVDVRSPIHADVTVRLSWQARVWQPPAPRSRWAGCAMTETWSVVLQNGRPRIRTLRTETAHLLPGSWPLPGLST